MLHKVIIRVDSSVELGSGHVMRCLTLALTLQKYGSNVKFISQNRKGNLNETIINLGFEVVELMGMGTRVKNISETDVHKQQAIESSEYTEEEDAHETISKINPKGKLIYDLLVVDHYSLGRAWETSLRPSAKQIMVIDDLANRRHNCDILLDQNWVEGMHTRYNELVPPRCIKLLGPEYALLREEFSGEHRGCKEMLKNFENIFLFFGGSDPKNLTGKMLKILEAQELSYLNVDVVIGSNNERKEDLLSQVKGRERTRMHVQVKNISDLMCNADLAIGTGGISLWERCILGLPSIVVVTAENQRESCQSLSRYGALLLAGDYSDKSISHEVTQRIHQCIQNDELLRSISQKAKSIMSGWSNNNLAEKIFEICGRATN